ncbi:aldehyde dehydrogenase family protein [Mangrovihabitans endophyticus]|uniref:Succinate-semialdehyde dehydrogenase n=1 Tax=Mangrovihabitans endophyticus TaxID=1751298 RepID=A0A8J3FRS6_9ACTN|nr:aldehyde dehydrogenase family protein [Mangrovihabitans endophyticus]GGL09368.1 succinate-semialdehyde dehydrogenase [Mangrovihabitans endophyticus]
MPTDPSVTGLFIDGVWEHGRERLAVLDKFTGERVAELSVPGPDEVDRAVAGAAVAAGRPWSVTARAATLRGAVARLGARRAEIVAGYVAETGFTPADAATELDRTLQIFELCAQEAERLTGELVPLAGVPGHERSLCFTQRVPVGVVVAVTPFNAPLSTVAHKIAPALAAGNAVVLKPAEQTPLCAVAMVEALHAAGVPDGRIQLLCGPGETVGDRVVRHPAVGYVTFTGSTAVGRHIRAVCGLARTQLELGSNSPTLLWRDADLDLALPLVVRAGFRKAGQVCTSVQRLLVHRDLAEEAAGRLAGLVGALHHGDPRDPGTDVGPVISAESGERVAGLLADARSAGARVLIGGRQCGSMVAPALLADLTGAARLAVEEAFGPLVAMSTVDSFEAAVAAANRTRFGLQAGVFCRDLDVAFAFARELRMGGVIINDTSSYHPDPMPYGGVKDSGQGVEGPRYSVRDMTDSRTVVLRLRDPAG